MRNRAKCKLCESILESFFKNDYVTCKCKEISIYGGEENFGCAANNWENFLRVDDQDNIIIPEIRSEESDVNPLYIEESPPPPDHAELIKIFEEMIKDIDKLPDHAKTMPVTQYDLMSLMLILVSLFKTRGNE